MTGPAQLTDWMQRRRFNTGETADYLGLDISIVSKLANGSRSAGLMTAILLERKTGIPVESWAGSVSAESDRVRVVVGAKSRKAKADKTSRHHATS